MIKIYSLPFCRYCVNAKQLLDAEGVEYEEIDIMAHNISRSEMAEIAGGYTVPQIVIHDIKVGGYTDLLALKQSGELDKILNQVGEPQ